MASTDALNFTSVDIARMVKMGAFAPMTPVQVAHLMTIVLLRSSARMASTL